MNSSTTSPSSLNGKTQLEKSSQDEIELVDSGSVRRVATAGTSYRVYKRRWIGLVAMILLNIVLFSSIADDTAAYYRLSLTKVNWLANIVCALYIIVAPCIPFLLTKIGFRYTIILGAVLQTIGAWLRYASFPSLSSTSNSGAYALLFLGSVLGGLAQPLILVLGPLFSERWMSPNFRTISTMLIAVSNPFGGAISYIISPAIVTDDNKDFKTLLILAGILTTVISLTALGVMERPPTPPSAAAEEEKVRVWEGVKAILGVGNGMQIAGRKRADFLIIASTFTVFIAFFGAFSIFVNQIFEPYGYSSDAAGYIGAALIFSGLVGAAITAPVIDRFFPHPNDYPGIYFLAVLNGAASFSLLPVALELAAEVLYPVVSPGTTSSIMYLFGNGFTVVVIVAMDALRAGSDAHPPKNMKKSLIFQGVICAVTAFPILFLKGQQDRRLSDEARAKESES
ncbi:MFS general substrate transporter [Atractiella rhizophila]|nr:MFS general substrate transporter [Atractiella rhizophila]